jgi:hypothetical protein
VVLGPETATIGPKDLAGSDIAEAGRPSKQNALDSVLRDIHTRDILLKQHDLDLCGF